MTKAGYQKAVAVVAAAVLAVPLVAAFPARGASEGGELVGYTVGEPYFGEPFNFHRGTYHQTQVLMSIGLETGETTVIAPTSVLGLAFSPDGTLYGVGPGHLMIVDPSTGIATPVGPLGVVMDSVQSVQLAFDCVGNLWMVGRVAMWEPASDFFEQGALFRVDPATGAAEYIGSVSERLFGLTGQRRTLFGVASGGDGERARLVTVDTATGKLSTAAQLPDKDERRAVGWAPSVAFGPGGRLWALGNTRGGIAWPTKKVWTIDTYEGTATWQSDAATTGSALAIRGGACSTPLERDYDHDVMAFGDAGFYGSTADVYAPDPIVDMAASRSGRGYWLVTSGGDVFEFGDAIDYGSASQMTHEPIVAITATPTGGGYWLVDSGGAVLGFGDATFYGSTRHLTLKKPIVDMASTVWGDGYWLVASDGGIFSFGTARFHGSTGDINLKEPIVGMAATPSDGGYWLVASDGGVFAFGDAGFHGSTGHIELEQPIRGMAADPDGDGYWLAAADGGVFAFDVPFFGSAADADHGKTVVAITASRTGKGYWLAATDLTQ